MKEIFNPKRFGNYFLYDLRNVWQNFGLSAILLGLLPVFMFGLQSFIRLTTSASTMADDPDFQLAINTSVMSIAFSCWVIIMTLVFPEKTYGYVTSKKAGSNFLLLPASSFEKTLSMVLIAGIIVPSLSAAVFLGSDRLLSLIPSHGPDAISSISLLFEKADVSYNFNPLIGLCILSLFTNMMMFTLGAIFFKKGKAAKTLLCSIILSIIVFRFYGTFSSEAIADIAMSGNRRDVSLIPDVFYKMYFTYDSILAVLLLVGIFFRIKTLKH